MRLPYLDAPRAFVALQEFLPNIIIVNCKRQSRLKELGTRGESLATLSICAYEVSTVGRLQAHGAALHRAIVASNECALNVASVSYVSLLPSKASFLRP